MDLLGQQGQHPYQEHGPGPGQVQDQGQLRVSGLDLVTGGVQGKVITASDWSRRIT